MVKRKLKIKAKGRKKDSKSSKKGLGKGTKVFALFLVLAFLMLLLCLGINGLIAKINEAKSVYVDLDMEYGTSGDGPGQFKEPWDVATDTSGNFYVSDFGGHRIQKFDPAGNVLMTIGKEGQADGEFEQPSGIFVASDGFIYVCDTFNKAKDSIGRIQKFDSNGNFVKSWSHNFFGPRSIVGNNSNRLYVSDTGNHKIQVFDTDGNFLSEWGGFGTSDGKFREPMGCVLRIPRGDVFVADSDNRRVQEFDTNGKFLGIHQGFHLAGEKC